MPLRRISARRRAPGAGTRTRAAAAACAALAIALTACGGSDKAKTPAGATQEAKAGGSLTMLALSDSRALDPFTASGVAVADEPRLAALYDPLVYLDPTDGSVRPHLAESLTTADRGATWTLKLRAGVKFSDGTDFTADAVKLTWETHAKPETRSTQTSYATGLALRVVDPLTLEITPKSANPNFDRLVATRLTYIAAPSALAKGVAEAGAKPVGAGPFVLQSWTRGSEQVFVRNPNYWQKDKGLPKLDKLTIKAVQDREQQYTTVKAGGADLVPSSYPDYLDRAEKELRVAQLSLIGGQHIAFNLRQAPFDDIRARRALALALDPAEVPKALGNGFVPAKNFFNHSSPFFDPSAAQAAQNEKEAQRLFDELAAEGRKVDFTYTISQTGIKVAELMKSRLDQYRNVSMRIEPLDIAAFVMKFNVQRNFQAGQYQSWLPDPEPEMWSLFHSASPLNQNGWKNAQADKALDDARASTDPAVRKQAYATLQKAMAEDLPVWVYAESTIGIIYAERVTGVQMYNAGSLFMDRLGLSG
ncbi:ABC transporter substrate-binding protein [Streptodolium elevatio]|uniref:ABC transporter substrate-binding protein n=1 Tax=Streptodolium elevatio TaxID=3157996 RepID=A0ABV3DSP7_9ACTN